MVQFNKTYLSLDNAEERGFIHRDYIAHCLRWTHVIKALASHKAYQSAHILDIGCGKETPLAKMLYSSKMHPKLYVGVDVGSIEPPLWLLDQQKFPMKLYSHCDFTTTKIALDSTAPYTFDFIVCFEVLEHMGHDDGVKLISRIKQCLCQDTHCFLSTPCYNGEQANNHIYEWKYQELKDEFQSQGFKILNHWGTFASIRDYENTLRLHPEWYYLFEKLRGYYDTNYLATIFAPLFPEKSRNVLWELVI